MHDCILPGSPEGAHQHSPGACGPIIEQASAIGDEYYDESSPVETLGTGIPCTSRHCFPVLKYVHVYTMIDLLEQAITTFQFIIIMISLNLSTYFISINFVFHCR